MSRIGKKIINLPVGVEAEIKKESLSLKGPKGVLNVEIHPRVSVSREESGGLRISVSNPEVKKDRALWGLFGSLVKNMIEGVTNGFEKKLEMNGIGFKAEVKGKNLILDVGFSHPVNFVIPAGIEINVEKNVINIRGVDKQAVGNTAAMIRNIRKPEPYKGKGIKYIEEIIRRKAGKAAIKAAA